MPSANSTIRVSIIGDTKGLDQSLGKAQSKIGGFAKGLGGALVGLAVIDKGFEFAASSLEKADKMADAFDRLDSLITPAFSKQVEDTAFGFTNIGLSADEVGDLATSFAAIATASGASSGAIAAAVPGLLDVAAAISAKTGKTVDEVVVALGKAAGGSAKGVKEFGIIVDTALSPDEQITSILTQAQTLFGTAGDAANDYAGKQEALNAKWDNFSIKVGQALEGPLSGMLDFFITIIDRDIPNMMKGFDDAGRAIDGFARTVLGPLGNINDILGGIGDFFGQNHSTTLDVNISSNLSDSATAAALLRQQQRNGDLGRP